MNPPVIIIMNESIFVINHPSYLHTWWVYWSTFTTKSFIFILVLCNLIFILFFLWQLFILVFKRRKFFIILLHLFLSIFRGYLKLLLFSLNVFTNVQNLSPIFVRKIKIFLAFLVSFFRLDRIFIITSIFYFCFFTFLFFSHLELHTWLNLFIILAHKWLLIAFG